MNTQLIDLSLPMEVNKGEIAKLMIQQTFHKKGGDIFGRNYAFSEKSSGWKRLISILHYLCGKNRISSKTFPGKEFLNLEIITASTHTGTHFDAPLHFGSKCEERDSLSIDQIPIEWCYGDGIVLDLTYKTPGDYIFKDDIERSLKMINYQIKPFDIVLIRTGADKYWGKKEYLFKYPGMSRESIEYLVNQGVKIVGIDSYGFDRPFSNMLADYFKTKDNSYLFPAHFYGRERCYCHIERLTNLDIIPNAFGFKVVCFPIKIKNAGAAWVRVVAIC
jgi:kynurenine formamidase